MVAVELWKVNCELFCLTSITVASYLGCPEGFFFCLIEAEFVYLKNVICEKTLCIAESDVRRDFSKLTIRLWTIEWTP